MNKDFNCRHMGMVTGKVSTPGTVDLVQGTYHHFCEELKESLVEAARKNVKQTRRKVCTEKQGRHKILNKYENNSEHNIKRI